ncbi:MAG: hypothetical protein ACTSX9_05030 [Candidatus Njordarchaeales archaeon]
MNCKNCKFYIPSEIFPKIGTCSATATTVFADDSCEKISPIDIEEAIKETGKIYCLTCRTWVFEWNLDKHRDHVFSLDVIDDEFLHEEINAVD